MSKDNPPETESEALRLFQQIKAQPCRLCRACKVVNCGGHAHFPDIYNNHDSQRVMVIFETPLTSNSEILDSKKNALEKGFFKDYVTSCQKGLAGWSQQWDKLGEILTKSSLLPGGLDRSNLPSSIYVTDVIKCSGLKDGKSHGNEKLFAQHRSAENLCLARQSLQGEISGLKNLQLILCMGKLSWDSLRLCRQETITHPSGKLNGWHKLGITQIHGHYFEFVREKGTVGVIPLAFLGRRVQYLRNSFWEYLADGMEEWRKRHEQ